jgi:hypothetical protein
MPAPPLQLTIFDGEARLPTRPVRRHADTPTRLTLHPGRGAPFLQAALGARSPNSAGEAAFADQPQSLVDKIARNTAVNTVAEIADEIAEVVQDAVDA